MKELFIREEGVHGFSVYRLVTLLVAAVFLVAFAGCTQLGAAAVDKSKPWASISFKIDKSSKYAPTFAVWVEDASTGEAVTLMVTKKASADSFRKGRPGALPVWSGARARAGAGKEDVDAVSSATPGGSSASFSVQIPDQYKGKKINFYIEANVSYDYNGYYKEGLKSEDAGYNGVNGQPSVVWMASADTAAAPKGKLELKIVGHGDAAGASGNVDTDMSNVTSAAKLFSDIVIEYSMEK